ncbi:MAG: hypothetical protein ACD_2C00249G0002 [uncultured bacterium (gcode 4)]|uniref:Uncharacterized protein n=1 Tax=uncultured bacterium (gcode 4) TaxID=1234023 RepID=K2G3Y0_9BACT|nr:MAG: hypothetical protein ACD_2C00249G0002 [uncultured bacterium (gcode 4)]
MFVTINTLLSTLIVGLYFYWKKYWIDGYAFLSLSVLFYSIMWNILFFLSKRRINKWKGITFEFAIFTLMLLIGNWAIYSTMSLICSIECFWIDIVFFDVILLLITSIIFLLRFFLTANNKQKMNGWIITFILLWIYLYSPIKYWYTENFIITRFQNSENYYKDKDYAYCELGISKITLEWADVNTFIALDDTYAKDKNQVYYLCDVIPNANSETFKIFNEAKDYKMRITKIAPEWYNIGTTVNAVYSKDKNQVYFLWNKISWANSETFKSLWNGYAKDDLNNYFEGSINNRCKSK